MDFINAIYELESTVLRKPRVDVLARGNEVISTHLTFQMKSLLFFT